VYATCVGQAVKWFPDRRGLAVGLTAAGYGAGAALTVVPIRAVIAAAGYETAFFWFGLIQGGVVFVLAWLLRAPDPDEMVGIAASKVVQTARSYRPSEALSTPVFWLLYIMFIMVSASGLMATAQIAPIAKDFNVGDVPILFGASALSVALIIDSICNGGARPLFGWISDQIGREYTMAIAFGLGGVAYWLLGTLGHSPWAFVLFAALIFLTWGKSSACSRQPARTLLAPSLPPSTSACSTLPKVHRPSWFQLPTSSSQRAAAGTWSSY
jgi:OFA family oxalate/formate antiporter-like MFS transporter